MAITTPTLVGALPVSRAGPYAANSDQTAIATAAVALVASPGAGKSLYITSVSMSQTEATDVELTLLAGAAVIFGPIQLQADGGGILTKDFQYPLRVGTATALNVIANANKDFLVYVEYWIGE